MRIYDGDFEVGRILEDCQVDPRTPAAEQPGVVQGVNLAKLNKRLNMIDVKEIRRRRDRLELFSQEVLVGADPDRGISFTSCLMILAHYNIINDSKSLRLEEFLRRRYRLQRVEEEVRRRVVINFFDTLYYSRAFRRKKELRHSARMVTVPQFAVPEIFVDDDSGPTPIVDTFADASPGGISPGGISTGGISPLDIASTSYARSAFGLGSGLGSSPPSPSGLRARGESFGSSPSRSEYSYNPSPTLRPRRPSDLEDCSGQEPVPYHGDMQLSPQGGRSRSGTVRTGASFDGGSDTMRHRRQQSSVGSSGGTSRNFNALEVFEDSAWGESIRRSFTVRRQGTRRRG